MTRGVALTMGCVECRKRVPVEYMWVVEGVFLCKQCGIKELKNIKKEENNNDN